MFGILSIMYLMVLEVFILGVFVFVIGPVIYVRRYSNPVFVSFTNCVLQLIWSLILIARGRHPLQNPTSINPEIGKMPRSAVDRIPLVMYIPPPPSGFNVGELAKPEAVYSYPPKLSSTTKVSPRPRFRFLRRIPFRGNKDTNKRTGYEPEPERHEGTSSWENVWEQGELPFVVLEDNRAACAICLNDFEAPKQRTERKGDDEEIKSPADNPVPNSEVLNMITEEERSEPLRLEDAGEGAQPLRLLRCGHVFHVCLPAYSMSM